MADEENEQEGQGEKKGPPKLILFVVIGMVVLAVAAFILVKFVFAPKEVPEEEVAVEEVVEKNSFEKPIFYFEKAIIVNLAETNGQRYLKANPQFVLSDAKLEEEMQARHAQLLDLVISILSSKTIEDISSTIGRNRLKREVVERINAELVTGKVVNIWFTEFVIQ